MISLEGYKKALHNLPGDIKEAEVNAEQRACILIGVTGGEVACTDVSDITALYVRASGEKTGYAYTQDLGEDPGEVLSRAYRNGLPSEKNSMDRLNTPDTAFSGIFEQESVEADAAAIKNLAAELEHRVSAAHSSIRKVLAVVRLDTFSSLVINSKGVDAAATRNVYYASAKVMAEAGGKQYDASCSVSACSMDALELDDIVRGVSVSLENQFNAAGFVPGEYPVVLDRTAGINIMTTAWQLFSGLKYCDGSTVLKGKLGEQIGSRAFNVIDVPAHTGTGYRFPFDCEGTRGKETILVDQGKLSGLLHNIASADLLGAE